MCFFQLSAPPFAKTPVFVQVQECVLATQLNGMVPIVKLLSAIRHVTTVASARLQEFAHAIRRRGMVPLVTHVRHIDFTH